MTVVFLTNASVSPWSKPGDWQDAGHTVNLVGAGGRGGTTATGTSYRSGSGGGGGGHVLNTYSSGALSSTTPFFININYAGSVGNDAATAWGSGTVSITNSYYVQGGTQGVAGGAAGLGGVTTTTLNGTPPTPVYTQSQKQNGGNGGATGAVLASAAGGGGAGGPSGVGGAGGPCATASRGGGGGGGSNGGATGGGTSASANGAAGGGGAAGGSSGVAAVAGATNTGGGGGGGFFTAVVANVSGAAGGDEDIWTQTVGGATDGPGGGGGGAGACSVNTAGATCNGGNGANYGAGGGGAGGTRSATSTRTQGAGASGLIVITYTAYIAVAHDGEAIFAGAGSLSAVTLRLPRFAEARFGAHPTRFDPGFLSANARLLNDDLTVIATPGAGALTSTRSKIAFSKGKFYCEFFVNAKTAGLSGAASGVGICNASQTTSQSLSQTLNAIGYHEGTVYINSGTIAFIGGYEIGDIIGMAINFDTEKIWWRVNDGNWNASGSADPETGVGGIDFSSLNAGPYYVAVECRSGVASKDSFTVDFEGSGAFTPADLPGLVLWLKADAGVTLVSGKVSLWEDQSGMGNHVSQSTAGNRPTYDATGPAVVFAANHWLLSDAIVDLAGLDSLSSFAVINHVAATQGFVLSCLGSGQTNDNNNLNSAAPLWFGSAGSAANLSAGFSAWSIVLASATPYDTNIRIGDVIFWDGNQQFVGYLDGNQAMVANLGAGYHMSLTDDSLITIGNNQNSGPGLYPYSGSIAEIVVTKNKMTAQQIALLDDYFVRRWTFYKGPGDMVGSATAWWGLRAYSEATIGTNAVRLRESGGNTEQNFATIIGGGLDLAAIATFKGANNLFVVTLYDQTGNGFHVTQATAGSQPELVLSGFGSQPVVRFSSDRLASTAFATTAQPFTVSAVSRRSNTAGGTQDEIFSQLVASQNIQLYFSTTADRIQTYANGGGFGTVDGVLDGLFHAIEAVYNGASSRIDVDGLSTVVSNPGTQGLDTNFVDLGTTSGGGGALTGDIQEVGVWPVGFTLAQSLSVSDNQHEYWGIYTGPGDVVSGAVGWWGLRAYSSDTVGDNAVRLRESGSNNERDFATIAGGGLDLAAIAAFKGLDELFVVTLYDQTGNGRHATQATAGNQPRFTLNSIGLLPAIDNTAILNVFLETSALTQAQPFTISLVANKINTTRGNPVSSSSFGVQLTPGLGSAEEMFMFAGASLNRIDVSANYWHAHQCVFNGASSDNNLDGRSFTGNPGASGFVAEGVNIFGGGGIPYPGYINEVGLWPSAFSGASSIAMSDNQHEYWRLYLGPGDIVSGATAWWGLRAYSMASIGTKAVRLREDYGNSEQDFATIEGGGLDLEAIAAFKGSNNLFVVKLYDQTGNGNDLVQTTAAAQPSFNLATFGAKPAVYNSSGHNLTVASFSQSQPFTISTTLRNLSSFAGSTPMLNSAGNPIYIGILSTTSWRMLDNNGGAVLDVNVGSNVNVPFAWQAVFNAGASASYINGTNNTGGTIASGAMSGLLTFPAAYDHTNTEVGEGGVWPVAFDATQRATMDANQRHYWGF